MIISDETYISIKENSLTGRYITHGQISGFLENTAFNIETIGRSVEQRTIQAIILGTGPQKVLMWSQMHGNESTTTKAVVDLINYFANDTQQGEYLLDNCTIKIIPMLNPDGAEAYTRVNANGVDLNRDAQKRTQPESQVLREVYHDFLPNYCFNLHDQRTIYNVGETDKPATVSFLSPAFNDNRDLSPARLKSMALIHAMNEELQKIIPGQVGRYDDAFNANCVGDTFQILETPTVLFEAGHYQGDYQREETRKFVFFAMLKALYTIANGLFKDFNRELYFQIPENNKRFCDILIYNAHVVDSKRQKDETLGILYHEELANGKISFNPKIDLQGNLKHFFGHREYDCADEQSLNALKKDTRIMELIFR
ncbi:M14 metallopeptidase family protein [Maribacter algicola]|uniref:M14 metallopeptidase family protein n=1 Tax=Meishania litoralis TaxID=3434685 RepID=A0ACC7LKJ4_9FLAO